jgi:hypothetical protein
VASLNDNPFFGYQLGFPQYGRWAELFNSDVYDNWVNPLAVGNYGAIYAGGVPMHDLPYSAARDSGVWNWLTADPGADGVATVGGRNVRAR